MFSTLKVVALLIVAASEIQGQLGHWHDDDKCDFMDSVRKSILSTLGKQYNDGTVVPKGQDGTLYTEGYAILICKLAFMQEVRSQGMILFKISNKTLKGIIGGFAIPFYDFKIIRSSNSTTQFTLKFVETLQLYVHENLQEASEAAITMVSSTKWPAPAVTVPDLQRCNEEDPRSRSSDYRPFEKKKKGSCWTGLGDFCFCTS